MADQMVLLADVKTALGITDVNDDALLTSYIEDLTDWVQDRTKRKLVSEAAATYTVDTTSGSTIYVPRGIRTVTALGVASSSQPDTGGVYTAVALADVLIRPLAIDRRPGWPGTRILIRGSYARLANALNGATITGDWGFAATPPALRELAIDAIGAAYLNRQGGPAEGGDQGTPIYPWTRFFAPGSPEARALDAYTYQGIG